MYWDKSSPGDKKENPPGKWSAAGGLLSYVDALLLERQIVCKCNVIQSFDGWATYILEVGGIEDV